jgi:hypothetical protein
VQNLNPQSKSIETTASNTRGVNIEGANIESIKNSIKNISKNTLSPYIVISKFYTSIGQRRVAKEKREG